MFSLLYVTLCQEINERPDGLYDLIGLGVDGITISEFPWTGQAPALVVVRSTDGDIAPGDDLHVEVHVVDPDQQVIGSGGVDCMETHRSVPSDTMTVPVLLDFRLERPGLHRLVATVEGDALTRTIDVVQT